MKKLSFNILLSFFVLLLSCSIIGPDNNDSIELRVTWEIPVGFEDAEWPGWNIYVDTTTSVVVRIEQLFDT